MFPVIFQRPANLTQMPAIVASLFDQEIRQSSHSAAIRVALEELIERCIS